MANPATRETEEAAPGEPIETPLGLGWTLAVTPRAGGAVLRIARGPGEAALDLRVSLTADGPVVRTRATTLELVSAREIVARCERFRVEARESVEIASQGGIVQQAAGGLRVEGRDVSVESTRGDIRLRANDDVQLLGEQVLLNCDRQPPVPSWAPVPPAPHETVPRADVSGDDCLFDELPPEHSRRR